MNILHVVTAKDLRTLLLQFASNAVHDILKQSIVRTFQCCGVCSTQSDFRMELLNSRLQDVLSAVDDNSLAVETGDPFQDSEVSDEEATSDSTDVCDSHDTSTIQLDFSSLDRGEFDDEYELFQETN